MSRLSTGNLSLALPHSCSLCAAAFEWGPNALQQGAWSQHISRVSLDNSLPSAQLHLIFQEDFRKFLYVLYKAQQISLTFFAELSHSLAGPSLDAFDTFLEVIFFSPVSDDFLPSSSFALLRA